MEKLLFLIFKKAKLILKIAFYNWVAIFFFGFLLSYMLSPPEIILSEVLLLDTK